MRTIVRRAVSLCLLGALASQCTRSPSPAASNTSVQSSQHTVAGWVITSTTVTPGENPDPVTPRPVATPSPTVNVTDVALHEETRSAREGRNQRNGSATSFTATVRPATFRTEDGRSGWRLPLGQGRPLATPAVVHGTVFIGHGFGSHEFSAVNALTGETRWALRVSDDGPTAAVVDEGVVAFNTESCTLFVVDEETGRPLWSRWLGDPLMSQPTIADGKIFMAFPSPGGHRMVAFELRTGRELWRVPLNGDIISAPVVHGDAVYASTFDGTIVKHRISDGGLAWREAFRATSAPWLYGDQVFASHREDRAAGAVVPQRRFVHPLLMFMSGAFLQVESVGRISGATGAATHSGNGYRPRPASWLNTDVQRRSNYRRSQADSDTSVGFSTAPATARAAEAEANVGQGTVRGLWEFQGSRPIVVDGRLFLTQGDQLVAMDPDTGRELWTRPLAGLLAEHGGHLASPPSAAGGRLYLATVTGAVLVVSQRDGTVVDTVNVGSPMRFQPAVVEGRLYVGTANGELVMIDLRDPGATGWTMWGGGPRHNGPEAR